MNREHSEVGFKVVADTNAVATAQYFGIQVIGTDPAVIDSITYEADYEADSLATHSLPNGIYIPCRFTTLTLTSGSVICHKSRKTSVMEG